MITYFETAKHHIFTVIVISLITFEFSGPTIFNGRNVYKHDFDSFLAKWFEMRQKYYQDISDPEKKRFCNG